TVASDAAAARVQRHRANPIPGPAFRALVQDRGARQHATEGPGEGTLPAALEAPHRAGERALVGVKRVDASDTPVAQGERAVVDATARATGGVGRSPARAAT